MVNYLAVIVVTVIGYILGALWYSPMLLGKPWMKLTRVRNTKMTLWIFIGEILSTLILCYVLAFVIQSTGVQRFIDGALIGILLWLGCVATVSLERILHEKMPWELFWISAVRYLIIMLVAGGILAVWQ